MVSRRSRRATKAKTAVAYIRVSKDDQDLSPEGQRADIEAWAKREGVQVVAWHVDDGLCGALESDERPGLHAAIEDVRSGGATILVVTKRDRLARDTFVAAFVGREVEKAHGRVMCANGAGNGTTPADKMMRNMLDSFAEFEREQIKERTKRALQVKRDKGELTGKAPFGMRRTSAHHCDACRAHALEHKGLGMHLEADESEQATIARAIELAKTRTIRALTDTLNAEGHRTRNGTPFTFQGVYQWLKPLLNRGEAAAE